MATGESIAQEEDVQSSRRAVRRGGGGGGGDAAEEQENQRRQQQHPNDNAEGGGGGGEDDDTENDGEEWEDIDDEDEEEGGDAELLPLPQWEQQFYVAKGRFFSGLGALDRDLLTFMINPFFMGGVRWPNLRQAYRVVRNARRHSLILISDGLCEPVSSASTRNNDVIGDRHEGGEEEGGAVVEEEEEEEEDDIGLGVEVLVESSDPGLFEAGFADITSSWLFHVVQEAAGQVAAYGFNLLEPLTELGLMSMEINLEHPDIPRSFYNAAGRLVLLFGLTPPADRFFDATFQVPTSAAAAAAPESQASTTSSAELQQQQQAAQQTSFHTAKVVTVKLVSFEDFERLNRNRAALAAECTANGTFHMSSIIVRTPSTTRSDDDQQQRGGGGERPDAAAAAAALAGTAERHVVSAPTPPPQPAAAAAVSPPPPPAP